MMLEQKNTPLSSLGEKGFSLLELVLVLVLIAIVVIVAAPSLFNIADTAQERSVDGIASELKSAIQIQFTNNYLESYQNEDYSSLGDYPELTEIDSVDASGGPVQCNDSNQCLGSVMQQPLSNSWVKTSQTSTVATYTHTSGAGFTYDESSGEVATFSIP